ncbi:histidine phosphatase family protein [Bacillus sp. 1NLA3E]|uniref:histidine phosphatase family protein n=1 Tax=Bacillus sp. 1NLA3E TaxID=666686 RepID=UPI000247E93D|nr:histidine phosphatase family protein [Bacillus sp. 1NLA3E]AGK52179.1 alpha-ribazole phosphatase [Bacillus sp. 1NLA3E]
MQIIFVRHGQTDENAANRYLGHTDPSLNDLGRQQIVNFTKQFPVYFSENITSFYSSDLKRAQETAQIIRTSLLLNPPTPVPSLREMNFGDWECMTYERIMETNPVLVTSWVDNPFEVSPPNGETLLALGARFDTWLKQILHQAGDVENILIVCHGGPIRWFRSKWLQGDPKQFWNIEGIKHGTGIVVQYDKQTQEFSTVKFVT